MGRWTKILVVGAVITFIASIAIGVGCFKWRGAIRAPRRASTRSPGSSTIRPVVEQAYLDGRRALEQGDYDFALLTSCGILETIVTDALEHKGLAALIASGAPPEKISDWSFETRLIVAERAGLIRGGCARLPAVARAYRDQAGAEGNSTTATISERDARVTGQVLHVVMRDLDPGR